MTLDVRNKREDEIPLILLAVRVADCFGQRMSDLGAKNSHGHLIRKRRFVGGG